MNARVISFASQLRKALRKDILNRYDDNEYWNEEVIDTFCQDNGVTEKERLEMEKIVGLLD